MSRKLIVSLLLILLLAVACKGDDATPTPPLVVPAADTAVPPASDTPSPTETATATATSTSTPTNTPTATATATATVQPAANNGGATTDPLGDLAATVLPELLPSVIPEIPEIPEIPGVPEIPIPEIPVPALPGG